MRRQQGGHVCPRCGATGVVTLEDGTEAQFEPPDQARGGAARVAGLVSLGLAAAGLAGWWFRDELPSGFLQSAARPETAAPAPPDWRMARLGEFGEDLRPGVIGIFGTDGRDRMLAYTALGGGEIVAVLSHAEADEPATRASIVRIDGGAELSTTDLPAPDGITGASLAPAGVSGFYLAQTGPEGVTLSAYGEGVAPKWERRLIRTAVPKRSALVLSGGNGLFLIGPAETEGRISIAAYDTTGAQLWQRTFEAPEDGRVFGQLLEKGGIFLAYESLVSAGGAEANAAWLAPGGETVQATAGLRIDGRLGGAIPAAEGVLLLEDGTGVKLVQISAEGQRLSEASIPAAALRTEVALTGHANAYAVTAAYPLADVQTDLTETRFRDSGGPAVVAGWRLPPLSSPLLSSSVSGSPALLAGTFGEGAAADAFLLVLPAPQTRSDPDSPEIPAPDPGPALPPSSSQTQLPDTTIADQQATTSGAAQPGEVACRFMCRDGDVVFPLTSTLEEGASQTAETLLKLQAEACRRLGAEAADAAPVCG